MADRTNFKAAGYIDVVKDSKAGETFELPYGDFVPEDYRGTISAYCSRHFGKGNTMTAINYEKKVVEVLRLG